VNYLTVQDVAYVGSGPFEPRLGPLMDALLALEAADADIEDPDLVADLSSGRVEVQMTVAAADPAAAMVKAFATLRAAIHATGSATPRWETALAVMHVAPADAAEQLLTSG
jgi:hypothetical protein